MKKQNSDSSDSSRIHWGYKIATILCILGFIGCAGVWIFTDDSAHKTGSVMGMVVAAFLAVFMLMMAKSERDFNEKWGKTLGQKDNENQQM